jgi:hypothetical protein
MDMLKQIAAIFNVVEIVQRRGEHLDNVSDDEEMTPNPNP